MVYNYKELLEKYGSDYQIKNAIKNNKLFKIEPGIYSDNNNSHYLDIFSHKYPNAIISGDSAYYYHHLTDVIPNKICITTRRNSGRFGSDDIKQCFAVDNYFFLGQSQLVVEGITINIYNKERMLIELIRNKNSMPYDYYKEIICNYRKIKDTLDVFKVQEYACAFPNCEKILNMIQDEVF